jgi:hypothetical protein
LLANAQHFFKQGRPEGRPLRCCAAYMPAAATRTEQALHSLNFIHALAGELL